MSMRRDTSTRGGSSGGAGPERIRDEIPVRTTGTRFAEGRPNVVQRAAFVVPRDAVRWGPIVAGLLTALAAFILLSTLLLAIGANTVRIGTGQTDEAAAGAGIATAIAGLLSFLLGGFVAGRTAAVGGRSAGLLNGFLVWALGLLLILLLSAFGIGQLFGAAGDLFGQYRAAGSPQPEGVEPGDVAAGIRNAAIPAFLGLALPALAAAIGGLLGARDEDDLVADLRRAD
jgi:hypothetical protein